MTAATPIRADRDPASYEIIDLPELAARWRLPLTYLHHQTRTAAPDPLPVLRFGKFIRVEWECPELVAWKSRRRSGYK
jgi:hypothetical protein